MLTREKKFYINLLNAIKSYERGDIEVKHYPLISYLDPVNLCNLECPSCPTGLKMKVREKSILPYDRFCKIMDEWGDYLYRIYMYNNGEPFLNNDFIRMVKYASLKGILVLSSSNLNINLTQDDAELIATSGLISLKIGLDGITQEIYEKYRRRGSLELVLKNVKLISDAKKKIGSSTPKLNVYFHVFQHNEHELGDAEQFLYGKGIDSVNFSPALLPSSNNCGIKPPEKFTQYDVKTVYGRQIPPNAETMKCPFLWFAMSYHPNGSISPCCGSPYEKYDFGKMDPAKNSVLDMFNLPKYQLARGSKKRKIRPVYDDSMGLSLGQNGEPIDLLCSVCPAPQIMNQLQPQTLLQEIIGIFKPSFETLTKSIQEAQGVIAS